jgi:hypothetical protein
VVSFLLALPPHSYSIFISPCVLHSLPILLSLTSHSVIFSVISSFLSSHILPHNVTSHRWNKLKSTVCIFPVLKWDFVVLMWLCERSYLQIVLICLLFIKFVFALYPSMCMLPCTRALCATPINFRSNVLIIMKLGMNIIPLDITPILQISTDYHDNIEINAMRTSTVWKVANAT